MLENSGAELERMLDRQASRQTAPGRVAPRNSGTEQANGRRSGGQRGAGRAGTKNANPREGRARAGEARDIAPGYGGPGHRRRRWDAGGPDAYSPRHGGDPDYEGEYDEDPDEADDDADADEYADGDDYADDDDYADSKDYAEADHESARDGEAAAAYEEDAAYGGADGGYLGGADGRYRGGGASGYSGADGRSRGGGGGYRRGDGEYRGGGYRGATVFHVSGPPGYGAGIAGDKYGADEYGADEYRAGAGAGEADERTEVLINRGRRHARPTGVRRLFGHWRAILVAIAGLTAGAFTLALILPGNDATWPPSVAVVQKEIVVACENPNVVAEPTQVNFACGKDTRPILWVFSLLTSGDNPNYSDSANGRKGLEPITPAQGGDVAWSLNLHHPYDPANPIDSLEVAARAINNIVGGATVTGSNGAAVVQPGLESSGANCARYTGSSSLVTRQGFPAVCAQPVASPDGQAALVSDVFQQWMVGTPAQIAAGAGVLFENADNPGDARVQAILKTLPQTGL